MNIADARQKNESGKKQKDSSVPKEKEKRKENN